MSRALLQTPFLVFDDNYGFLALSAGVWTMAKMRDGAQWLSNHYAANDYYCEGEHVVGSWAGKGAEFFGIAGQQIEPQNEAFLRLFSGQTPEGEKLKPHESEIIGYDFQCSAQKSVSIIARLGGDERLLKLISKRPLKLTGSWRALLVSKKERSGSTASA